VRRASEGGGEPLPGEIPGKRPKTNPGKLGSGNKLGGKPTRGIGKKNKLGRVRSRATEKPKIAWCGFHLTADQAEEELTGVLRHGNMNGTEWPVLQTWVGGLK